MGCGSVDRTSQDRRREETIMRPSIGLIVCGSSALFGARLAAGIGFQEVEKAIAARRVRYASSGLLGW
jgi:hypothetical protein